MTIVGVPPTPKEIDVHEADINSLYLPFAQAPSPDVARLCRAAGDQAESVSGDPRGGRQRRSALPVRRVFPLGKLVTGSLQGARFNALLITCSPASRW